MPLCFTLDSKEKVKRQSYLAYKFGPDRFEAVRLELEGYLSVSEGNQVERVMSANFQSPAIHVHSYACNVQAGFGSSTAAEWMPW